MTAERVEMIRERLTNNLHPTELDIVDESARHAGHAGAASRLVYDAVDDIMHSEIHALSIQAKTPDES